MSSVAPASLHWPTATIGVDAAIETPQADIEIRVYGGFDPLTEEAIENARKAVEILSSEYGILAIIVPNTLYWSSGFTFAPYQLPVLEINGEEVARGRVLTPEEIVREALRRLGIEEEPRLILVPHGPDEGGEPVLSTW